MMTCSSLALSIATANPPCRVRRHLLATRRGTGPGWHIISQPDCAASPTTAALPYVRAWAAPLLIMHACCMCLDARTKPAACSSSMHPATPATHLASRHHHVARGLPHHTGQRLLLLAGADAGAVPCCTMPQGHSADGSLLAPARASRSMWLHLQQGSQFISLEWFGVQRACFTERKAARCEAVLLSV